MDRRFATFLALATLIVISNMLLMRWLAPPPQPAAPAAAKAPAGGKAQPAANGQKAGDKPAADKPLAEKPDAPAQPGAQAAAGKPAAQRAKPVPAQWLTLGSLATTSPYKMLVTFTNRGGAVERIELTGDRYLDLDDRSGYLGELALTSTAKPLGCLVRVVGAGTPAEVAGLKAGDVITKVGGKDSHDPAQFELRLAGTLPGDKLSIEYVRGGKPAACTTTLTRKPLAVIRPEGTDPLSFLLTLDRINDQAMVAGQVELPGLSLRSGAWQVKQDPKNPDEISFVWPLAKQGLEIVKTYRIASAPAAANAATTPAYHLDMTIGVRNTGDANASVAYRLDGPTGLPTEGWWYAYSSKISPVWWDSPGLRDFVVAFGLKSGFKHSLISAQKIIDGKLPPPFKDEPLIYMGVDAQYFSVVLIPQDQEPGEVRYSLAETLRAGPVPADANKKKLTDISCRLVSQTVSLKPGASLEHDYTIFAGPKRPELLAQYATPHGLESLVEYGMFSWVSRRLLGILHFFYGIVGNYGVAIIMLTVLVRLCMFPLSRKQAINAQKMQELQPEIKRIADKYKGNMEQRTKAQQELFRKHNYNPLSGCLPALVQLPIFLGLYRSLAVDIELRQAPLLSDSIRWCSNLAAPDMLWRWDAYLPAFLAGETGYLGPYLNVLPLVTIALFIWQQKMFMPPALDEQAAMQQKIMKYMMIVMGVMFFKVPSGLCLYFISSSLWGIAERKLLPKTIAARPPTGGAQGRGPAGGGSQDRGPSGGGPRENGPTGNGNSGNGASGPQARKQRGRK